MNPDEDRDLQESVDAIRRSYEQFLNGQSRPAIDALDDLGRRHGLSRRDQRESERDRPAEND